MQAIVWDDDTLGRDWRCCEIPEQMQSQAAELRVALLEFIADRNDTIMEKYLAGEDVSEKEIKAVLREAVLNREAVPVLCGSALKNKGIQPLLDAVIDYFPSPLDVPPIVGKDIKSRKQIKRTCDDNEPLSSLAFKIIMDEGRKLIYLRLYSGTLKVGEEVYNPLKGKKEKIARIFRMHANKKERAMKAGAGEIVAVMGLKNTTTGDTLCDPSAPVVLESIDFYKPVISVAVEPNTVGDTERLNLALEKIAEEDPTFKYNFDEDSGQTVISGMGELHLEIIANKILRLYKVPVRTGKPQVVYRETISASVESEGLFDREINEEKHFGQVLIRLEPLERGTGLEFVNKLETGIIPDAFLPIIEKAFNDATLTGTIVGYPLVDIKATLIDGSFREGASTEIGYTMATATAIKEGVEKAGPILLEPIMDVEIVTPNEFMGDIIADINSRKGRIDSIEDKGVTRIITAHVSLKEMFGYSTSLRSSSQGRASFTMKFLKFEAQG